MRQGQPHGADLLPPWREAVEDAARHDQVAARVVMTQRQPELVVVPADPRARDQRCQRDRSRKRAARERYNHAFILYAKNACRYGRFSFVPRKVSSFLQVATRHQHSPGEGTASAVVARSACLTRPALAGYTNQSRRWACVARFVRQKRRQTDEGERLGRYTSQRVPGFACSYAKTLWHHLVIGLSSGPPTRRDAGYSLATLGRFVLFSGLSPFPLLRMA